MNGRLTRTRWLGADVQFGVLVSISSQFFSLAYIRIMLQTRNFIEGDLLL